MQVTHPHTENNKNALKISIELHQRKLSPKEGVGYSLELELETVVSSHVDVRNRTQVFYKIRESL